MKINEVVDKNPQAFQKPGFWRGVASAIAPSAMKDYKDHIAKVERLKNQPGTVKYKGVHYKWLGQQWVKINPQTGKQGGVADKATQEYLNYAASGDRPTPKPAQQTTQPQATTTASVPQGEAQSATDLVDRLYKLHPDWAPEVASLILKRSQVSSRT